MSPKPWPKERLWTKYVENGETGCWEYTGHCLPNGYGLLCSRNAGSRKAEYAHRVAYELYYGQHPGELNVLHRCDNRRCIRPDHLFLGTQQDNMQDAKAKGRVHCGVGIRGCKVNEQVVKVVRWMHRKGVQKSLLARLHGVHPATMQDMISGRNWAHVV